MLLTALAGNSLKTLVVRRCALKQDNYALRTSWTDLSMPFVTSLTIEAGAIPVSGHYTSSCHCTDFLIFFFFFFFFLQVPSIDITALLPSFPNLEHVDLCDVVAPHAPIDALLGNPPDQQATRSFYDYIKGQPTIQRFVLRFSTTGMAVHGVRDEEEGSELGFRRELYHEL